MPTGRAPARLGSRARGADALDIEAVGGVAIAELRGDKQPLFSAENCYRYSLQP